MTAALFLTSCSRKIIPGKPVLSSTRFTTDSLPLSEIDVPLRINLKPLYETANKNVQTIYGSPGWPNDFEVVNCDTRYMYRFKRGPLMITAHANTVNFNFTGSYIIAGAQRICTGTGSNRIPITPWTPTCTCGLNEGERRVNIGFKALLTLKDNYDVSAKLQRLEPRPLDKCTVCFWRQDITSTVMDQLKVQLDDTGNEISDSLNRLNLRSPFQQLWDMLNTSIPMFGMGYLQINPEKLRLSTLYAQNDTLNISVGISARPRISLTKTVGYRTVVPDISDFNQRKGFSIFVDAVMDYDSLSQLLTRELYHKRVDMDKTGKYIIIERCEIYGAGNEKLIIKIEFSGPDKGTMYLTGRPYFNRGKNQVEIKDIDYDIHTRDLLIKTAKWLFNRRIINTLNHYSTFNIAAYADTLLSKVNVQLNRQWQKSVSTAGAVNNLQVMAIYPLTENLVLRCNIRGELTVRIDAFDF
ncbi:DUF4403 family protein [Agriterribacter sp.]|uniref:DUF4403 family protein n=1 Tax=Agriterribacter sp. TaxID=2821509 RepID=UPI002CD5E080|nr:DUF4403 family protein [Agriterribacter sp.]HTN05407.1 DUF4403 family protein [Agriterribacter sp.]